MLLFVVSSVFVYTVLSQECNTPILKDIISVDSGKRADLENNLGTSTGELVPLLNQSQALEIRHLGNFQTFNTPIFRLDTSYWITAIDIQFGSVGSCTGNGEIIAMQTIRIGDGDAFTNPFIQIGYATGDIMNMTELGDPNNGRIIRLKINPVRGSFIRYRILTTEPPGSNTVTTFLCLRTEFYGCAAGSNSAPNSSTFLQYNLVAPTASGYTDPGYSGVRSQGYLSGGRGLLTDGTIGSGTDPGDWVGWSDPDLSDPEMLLLFSSSVSVKNVSAFYWGAPGAASVRVSGQTALSEETQRDGGVYRRVLSFAGFSTGLVALSLLGTETALLTEVQLLDSAGNSILGTQLDTSRFELVIIATTTEAAETTTTATSVPATSSVATIPVRYQTTATSMTSPNSTSVPVSPAVISAVLGILAAGLLLLLALLVAPIVACLFVRRRRGRGRKEEAKRIQDMIELGLYDPVNKQPTNDPYYENPSGDATEENKYAEIEDTATVHVQESTGYYEIT